MALLELVRPRPDWSSALDVALTRPGDTPERRAADDPWDPDTERPRRVSDDLAWLRQAVDEPPAHGLKTLDGDVAAVGIWEPAEDESALRLARLQDRGVLDAAGFLLHEPDALDELADELG